MAAGAAAAHSGANLALSYAAVQSSLRKQFYGDLVDLRGALLNTMSVSPHRAASLQPKMSLIDHALTMLEESKSSVTNAEMAQLMNMSAKVGRAVEAWRSRKPSARPPLPDSSPYTAPTTAVAPPPRFSSSSPFAAPELQQAPAAVTAAVSMPSRTATTDGGSSGAPETLSVRSLDRFDFLSRLISGDAASLTARANSATLLPDIDWEVPELKPSGNLDGMLSAEQAAHASAALASRRAHAQAQQQAQQQQQKAARLSNAEAFLAHVASQHEEAQAAAAAAQQAARAPSGSYRGSVAMSPLHDPGSGVGLSGGGAAAAHAAPRGAANGAAGITSPVSVCQPGASPFAAMAGAQPEASSGNSAGGGSAGGSAAGAHSASASPALAAQQAQQLAAADPASYAAYAAALNGPTIAVFGPPLVPTHTHSAGAAPRHHRGSSVPPLGFGNAGSLSLSQGSHGAANSHRSTPGALAGLQTLGLGDGASLPQPTQRAQQAQQAHLLLQQHRAAQQAQHRAHQQQQQYSAATLQAPACGSSEWGNYVQLAPAPAPPQHAQLPASQPPFALMHPALAAQLGHPGLDFALPSPGGLLSSPVLLPSPQLPSPNQQLWQGAGAQQATASGGFTTSLGPGGAISGLTITTGGAQVRISPSQHSGAHSSDAGAISMGSPGNSQKRKRG